MAARGVDVNPYLPVHPTFLYESIWNLITFALLAYLAKRKKFTGQIFCMYMAMYGFGRMFIEGLRTDSLMLGNIRVSQLLGLIFFIVFGGLLFYIYLKERKEKKIIQDEKDIETGKSEFASILRKKDELEEEKEDMENIELEKKSKIDDLKDD
jgi:phosphatidylglycerol:prolipoprotein diacylglycerol transferase